MFCVGELVWRGCKDLENAGTQAIPEDLDANREQNERGKAGQNISSRSAKQSLHAIRIGIADENED